MGAQLADEGSEELKEGEINLEKENENIEIELQGPSEDIKKLKMDIVNLS